MPRYDISALPGPNNRESRAFGLSSEGHVAGEAPEPTAGVSWHAGKIPALARREFYHVLFCLTRCTQEWRFPPALPTVIARPQRVGRGPTGYLAREKRPSSWSVLS
jgi:hypothetical protein